MKMSIERIATKSDMLLLRKENQNFKKSIIRTAFVLAIAQPVVIYLLLKLFLN